MLLAPINPGLVRSDVSFFSKYPALLDILLRVGGLAIVVVSGLAIYVQRHAVLAAIPLSLLAVYMTLARSSHPSGAIGGMRYVR